MSCPVARRQESAACPYCWRPIASASRDHIFPKFLGGTRKIECCKSCNDVFGHTFEARARMQLHRLHVFISNFGLTLKSVDAQWPNAMTRDGVRIDFHTSADGALT